MAVTNQQVAGYPFLKGLFDDDYFPDQVVTRGKEILLRLCARIEAESPSGLAALYALTKVATEEFNALEAEFEAAGSEIETSRVRRSAWPSGSWHRRTGSRTPMTSVCWPRGSGECADRV